jgi:CheY-like chemotaxis protein
MSTHNERRLHVRARVPATATAWIERRCKGSYIVDNLSLGGAYLSGGPAILPNTQIELIVQLANEGVTINGRVLRSDKQVRDFGIAVAFESLSELAHTAVGGAVSTALEIAARESLEHPAPTVLVVDHSLLVREKLTRDIRAVGSEAVCFSTSIDAIEFLNRPDCRVRLALIDGAFIELAGSSSGRELVAFLAEERPQIRRVLMCDGGLSQPDEYKRNSPGVTTLLAKPWTPETLTRALRLPQPD